MADYFPLLERAVSGLKDSTPEARHAIYERARTALLGQLRSLEPAVPEEDVNRESAALDDAIQRLEARFRTPPSPPLAETPVVAPPVIEPPRRPQVERPAAPAPAAPSVAPPPIVPPAQRERPVFTPRPTGGDAGPSAPRPAPTGIRPRIGVDQGSSQAAAPARPSGGIRPLVAPWRSTGAPQSGAAGATTISEAAPEATDLKASRDTSAVLPPAPTLPVSNDADLERGARPAAGDEASAGGGRAGVMRPAAPLAVAERRRGKGFYAAIIVLLLIAAGIAVAAYRLRDRPGQITAAPATPIVTAPDNPNKIVGRAEGSDTTYQTQTGTGASGDSGAPPDATAEQAPPASPDQSATTPAPASPAPSVPAPPPSTTGTDTVDTPAIAVSQRAALLVDAPDDPQKVKTYVGNVVWRSESVSSGQDQPLSTAVRADVEIPDAKLSMSIVLKKNTEPQFPASHTLEFQFAQAPGNTLGPVKQMNVPEMRQNDSAPTGDPLAGLSAAITEDHFLVGLSQGPAKDMNMTLLQQRNWVDISILFASGKVAKITFEKGPTGQHIIDDAIKSWQ